MPTLAECYERERAENDAAHQRLTRLGIPIVSIKDGKLGSYSLTERIDMLAAKLRQESAQAPADSV